MQFLEAFMSPANSTPLANPNKPDIRHVPLRAVLLGLDSQVQGLSKYLSYKMGFEWGRFVCVCLFLELCFS